MDGVVIVILNKVDADALLPLGPIRDPKGCRLCGNRSPAHYCKPRVQAQAELERQLRYQLTRKT